MKELRGRAHDREEVMTGKDSTKAIFTADGISRTFGSGRNLVPTLAAIA